VLLATFACATSLQAQVASPEPPPLQPDYWTITPFIGPAVGGDLNDSALNLGVALGYNWSNRLAIEGQVGFMSTEQEFGIDFDTNVWTIDANLLYHFTEERFIPYIAGGLGLMRASVDLAELEPIPGVDDDVSNELAFNFGGGIKTDLTERMRFRGDLRFFNGSDLAPDFWRITAGLTFNLGRR
jgi:opacity protein-like surface antigen